jgi:RHS repeat-associated protein
MDGSTTNAAFSEYIYFDGKRAARRDYQSNVFYYFSDQVGSARDIFEVASGSHTASPPCFDADFYPFGGEHDFTNTCPQNYKFMGKERDPETNNDDFGARSYASAYGRFLSADWSSTPTPVPYANLTNPQTLNLYAMVSDNPESFADLDGHFQNTQVSAGNQSGCATPGVGSGSCGAGYAATYSESTLYVSAPKDEETDIVSFKDRTGIGVVTNYSMMTGDGKPVADTSVKETNVVSDGGKVTEQNKTAQTDKKGNLSDVVIKAGKTSTAPPLAALPTLSNRNPINMTDTQKLTLQVNGRSYEVTTVRTLSNVNADGSLKTEFNSHGLNTTFSATTPIVTNQ